VVFAGLDEGAAVPPVYIQEVRSLGVPYFPAPDRALRGLARLMHAPRFATSERQPLGFSAPVRPGVIPEYQAKRLLAPLGVPFPRGQLVRSLDEAQKAASQLGYPVVLKAQAAALPHKSDAGGVILNLKSAAELSTGWARLEQKIASSCPGLQLDGVLIEAMSASGVELIVGGRRDRDWGPVILVGFGGVQAEILQDVALLPATASDRQIVDALYELKSGVLFGGFRGSPALDVPAIAHLAGTLGAVLLGEPPLAEIDLNPVIVYPQGRGVLALDALLRVSEDRSMAIG
jgi:acyl-CoA synthetase (NDP forming)